MFFHVSEGFQCPSRAGWCCTAGISSDLVFVQFNNVSDIIETSNTNIAVAEKNPGETRGHLKMSEDAKTHSVSGHFNIHGLF